MLEEIHQCNVRALVAREVRMASASGGLAGPKRWSRRWSVLSSSSRRSFSDWRLRRRLSLPSGSGGGGEYVNASRFHTVWRKRASMSRTVLPWGPRRPGRGGVCADSPGGT